MLREAGYKFLTPAALMMLYFIWGVLIYRGILTQRKQKERKKNMWTKHDSRGMKTRVSTVSILLMLTMPEYKNKNKTKNYISDFRKCEYGT
jgi:hypothetical protein